MMFMPYVAAIAVVGAVIAIHEWGHLLAAKWCGIPIQRFSIGFGRKLIGFTYRGTTYWLSAIPFGGYVLPGLDESEARNLPGRKAVLFALGGPVANIVSAYLGLIALARVERSLPAIDALTFAATQLWIHTQLMARAIGLLFTGAADLTGVIGIVAIGGSQFGFTLTGLLAFSVAINLNLAMFNLLPLPPLDGGRVAFAILQKIYRPLVRIQAPVTVAGWVLMCALMIYTTVLDLGRIGMNVLS